MIIPITKLPKKVLRSPVKNIEFPLKKEVRRLLKDMLDTVKKADGIGLAAPQIGKDLNLAIIFLEHSGIPAFPLFNPRIVYSSKETVDIEEGCLSLPGLFGIVQRPKKITVEAENMEGKTISLTDDGWVARVIQHEVDHLNGTLIIDKFKKITSGQGLVEGYLEEK
jgi:peptide deformylase